MKAYFDLTLLQTKVKCLYLCNQLQSQLYVYVFIVNNLEAGHIHTNTHADICTETILRNQVHIMHLPAMAKLSNT